MSHELRVERVFDVAPEYVFDAFTDPAAQQELYGDEPGWIVEANCDLRVGGKWSISFGPADEEPFVESNVFKEVERPRHLVYRSTFTSPDGAGFDTDMDVTFEEAGGKTRMTIVQSGFPDAGTRDGMGEGWPGFADRLERAAQKRAAG